MRDNYRDKDNDDVSSRKRSKVHRIENLADIMPKNGVVGVGGVLSDRKPFSVLKELVNYDYIDEFALLTFLGSYEMDYFCKHGFSGDIISSAVTLELGMARNFRKAVEDSRVTMIEYSELAFVGALKAACMDLPFFPVRALFGSDILHKVHPNWKVVESPYSANQMCVAVPPFKIDIAIIHAQRADILGNVQIDTPLAGPYTAGMDYDLMLAKASQKTIVSVEEIVHRSVIRNNPGKTYIPSFLIDSVIHSPKGARPGSFLPFYSSDLESMVELLSTEDM